MGDREKGRRETERKKFKSGETRRDIEKYIARDIIIGEASSKYHVCDNNRIIILESHTKI